MSKAFTSRPDLGQEKKSNEVIEYPKLDWIERLGRPTQSSSYSLSESVSILLFSSSESVPTGSLQFHFDGINPFTDVSKALYADIVLIQNAIDEIIFAFKSLNQLFSLPEVSIPVIIGINTPTQLFNNIFPEEYEITRFGKKIYEIKTDSSLSREKRIKEWNTIIDTKIISRVKLMRKRIDNIILTKSNK